MNFQEVGKSDVRDADEDGGLMVIPLVTGLVHS